MLTRCKNRATLQPENESPELPQSGVVCYFSINYVYIFYTDTGDNTVLRQVMVPVVQWDRCRNIDSFYNYIKPNMICAGTVEGGKSSCNGDSGGPMVCKQGDRWFQYGIVNFRLTTQCAVANRPSVLGNVVALQSWIQEKTGSLYHYITTVKRLLNARSQINAWVIAIQSCQNTSHTLYYVIVIQN